MDASELLTSLNPAQQQAVCAPPGHYLVLAGAGSGKTRVLTERIAWLHCAQGIATQHILAVTFTNKAAGEMRQRVCQRLQTQQHRLWIGTFHGLAHRLLRLHWQEAQLSERFQIIDGEDQLRLVKRVISSLDMDENQFSAKQVAWWINSQKDIGRRPQHVHADPHNARVNGLQRIYSEYYDRCQRAGLLDFAELLLKAHELLRDNPALLTNYRRRFTHLLVDEFQDTSTIQYAFIRLLAGDTGQVFVVGDDDQAIYGWRGARVENVHQFLHDFQGVTIFRLEQNYRSTANILSAANAIIAHNPDRLGKQLWTQASAGDPITVYAAINEQDEARFVVERAQQWVRAGGHFHHVAILYRSNAQSRVFEEALLAAQVPYRVYGGMRFFERAEVKDALAYLRLVTNHHDDAAFERIINTPSRGIGKRTLEEIRQHAKITSQSLWDTVTTCINADGSVFARTRHALDQFIQLISTLTHQAAELTLVEHLHALFQQTQLREHWAKQSVSRLDSESRLDNLDELLSVAARFMESQQDQFSSPLALTLAFLTYASLEAGDGQANTAHEGVQLMTLHSAKGLEFPLVCLVGLEEHVFPSARAIEEEGRLDEERRLAYVGITRARDQLVLSYAESRRLHGQSALHLPSRFIREIPSQLLHDVRSQAQVIVSPLSRRATFSSGVAPIELGANVTHPSFGHGVVVDYEGRGPHARVQVQFDRLGMKWLVVAYAKLERLPNPSCSNS